jgi:hypothetical protein
MRSNSTETTMIPRVILAVIAGIAAALGFAFLSAQQAWADTVDCGPTVCYIDSSSYTRSSISEIPAKGGTPPSSTGGGTASNTIVLSLFSPCAMWQEHARGYSQYPTFPSFCYGHQVGLQLQTAGDQKQPAPRKLSQTSATFYDRHHAVNFATLHVMSWADTYNCYANNGRSALGRIYYVVIDSAPSLRSYCVYPTDENYYPRVVAEVKVYTGGQASFYGVGQSWDQAVLYGAGGTLSNTSGYINRGVDLSRPDAYVGDWTPSFTGVTRRDANGNPIFEYLRLQWKLDYKIMTRWADPAWMGYPAYWKENFSGTDLRVQGLTFACNTNPALQWGRVNGALFVPSKCQPNWECTFTNKTTVAGETDKLIVVRDGLRLQVENPTPSLIADPSRVRNVAGWQAKRVVDSGASPYHETARENSEGQPFGASWKWGQFEPYQPTGFIAFNWESNPNQFFSWSTAYRFSAEFYVLTQDSTSGSTYWAFVDGADVCPPTTGSPQITVLRGKASDPNSGKHVTVSGTITTNRKP